MQHKWGVHICYRSTHPVHGCYKAADSTARQSSSIVARRAAETTGRRCSPAAVVGRTSQNESSACKGGSETVAAALCIIVRVHGLMRSLCLSSLETPFFRKAFTRFVTKFEPASVSCGGKRGQGRWANPRLCKAAGTMGDFVSERRDGPIIIEEGGMI